MPEGEPVLVRGCIHRLPLALTSAVAQARVAAGERNRPDQGWSDPRTLAALITGLAAGIAFIGWELHSAQPMLDPRLFKVRGFSAGSLTVLVQFFASFGFVPIAESDSKYRS